MGKQYIVKGAMAQCNQSKVPMIAQLNLIPDNMFVNMNGNPVATTMTLGPVFGPAPFGICNMIPPTPAVPTPPCVCAILSWSGADTAVKINMISNPLTTDSKGTCALGGSISFKMSGQFPKPSIPSIPTPAVGDMNAAATAPLPKDAKVKHQSDMNPLAGNEEPTRYNRDFDIEQTTFSKKKNNKDVKKWTDKNGAEVDNPKSCNNLVLHYNEDFVPKNPKVNPPKPLRNEGKTDLMPWYGEDGIVEYYQKEGKIKDINPPVKDGKWDGSIPFNKDGVPDLEFLSRGTVTIGIKVYGKNILKNPITKNENGNYVGDDGRDENFKVADSLIAKQRGCSVSEVEKWRLENGYTWHEMDENGTMQKVPSAVHGAVYHHGGVDLFKKLNEDGKLVDFGFRSSTEPRKKFNF